MRATSSAYRCRNSRIRSNAYNKPLSRAIASSAVQPSSAHQQARDGNDKHRQKRRADHSANHRSRDPLHDFRAGAMTPHDRHGACDDDAHRHRLRSHARHGAMQFLDETHLIIEHQSEFCIQNPSSEKSVVARTNLIPTSLSALPRVKKHEAGNRWS